KPSLLGWVVGVPHARRAAVVAVKRLGWAIGDHSLEDGRERVVERDRHPVRFVFRHRLDYLIGHQSARRAPAAAALDLIRWVYSRLKARAARDVLKPGRALASAHGDQMSPPNERVGCN